MSVAGDLVERTDDVIHREQEYTRLERASPPATSHGLTPTEQATFDDVVSKRERMKAEAEAQGQKYEYAREPDQQGWRLYHKDTP